MKLALIEHLAANSGLVTTRRALELGVTHSSLRRLVETGQLIRMHRGVYRHAIVPATFEVRVRAGLLAVGDGGVLSHRAALAHRGTQSFTCNLVELTHCSLALPVREGMLVHRSRVVHTGRMHGASCAVAEVVDVGGIPTTTPARTLVDTAMVLPARLVARYAQRWIAERKVTIGEIELAIERAGNHPGGRRLRPELAGLVDGVDSVEEARLGTILRESGISPDLHVLVTTASGHTFELDWAFPDVLVGLELDGYGIHLRSMAAFDDDRWRRNELEIDGWQILNFTSRHIRRPARLADQVRRALRQRAAAAA